MLSRLLIACLLSAALPLAPAHAQTAAADAPAVAKPHKQCRDETPIGSLIPKRVCHTADEWAAIDATNERAAAETGDDMQRQSRVAPGGSPN